MEPAFLNEYRCDCGRLLFKGVLLRCKVEIKCKRCGKIKSIVFEEEKLKDKNLCTLDPCHFLSEIDSKGKFLSVNSKMAKELGYTAKEMIGRSLFEFVSKDDKSEKEKFLLLVKDEQTFRILKNDMLKKDREIITFSSFFIPQYDNSGFIGYKIASWENE
jgi:PAS domain S-box-containing protein